MNNSIEVLLSFSDMLFVPLCSTWSPTLHPCLMVKLSRGHIYHAEQHPLSPVHTDIHRGWYLLQVTQGHYSPSTRDESTNRSLYVLFLSVWRSHILSGDMIDVKQSHLSRRLSRSAAISNSYRIDFTSIGPLVIYIKKWSIFYEKKYRGSLYFTYGWKRVYENVLNSCGCFSIFMRRGYQ